MDEVIQSAQCSSARHSSGYLHAGDPNAPLVVFVHGWPELSLSWRHQLPLVAELGYFAVAPDMRGYGRSSVYTSHQAYALQAAVEDMLELLTYLDKSEAIWVGHDWGSPVVWSLRRHHPDACRAVASMCVPLDTLERGWDGFLPRIDRAVYPEEHFPAGQWEYMRFYEEHFDQATALFDSAPDRVIKALFRAGSADAVGQPSVTAFVRRDNGWFGGAGEVPDVPIDSQVITREDHAAYATYLQQNSFFGPDSWYMNHAQNAAYSAPVPLGRVNLPVLFLHGRYDTTCETMRSSLAQPMRAACTQLTEHVVDSGHWMAQEQPAAVNEHLATWLRHLAA